MDVSNDQLNLARTGIFVGVLVLMLLLEVIFPRRKLNRSKPKRWFTNLSVITIDTLIVRLILPLTTIGMAEYTATHHIGVFQLVELPEFSEILICVLLLDFAIYVQHVASHKIPMLWKVHRVHHADPNIDASTGIRFHPIEICLSLIYKFLLILLLGPSVFAVILFEIILNGTAVFNHANVRIPTMLDRWLRLVLVTPDVHRIHHSVIPYETNSNYGFNLTIWDRLCRTWREQPESGHHGMQIGLKQYQNDDPTKLGWSLMLPFRK